jgi:beta-glucanase (GH16 family)
MRLRRRRVTMSLLASSAAAAVALSPAPARAADLLRDDFNGTALDQGKWGIGTWLLGRTQLAFTPQVTGGMARLRLDTYNSGNTSLLRGTEILSDLSFTRGSGIEYEARVRTNPVAPGGTVTSFFTYIADLTPSPPLADEIDFEFLSKHINASPGPSDPVLATTWNNFRTDGSNFGDPNVHTSVNVNVPNLNLAEFNTFKIRWLPDRVQWYVNDVPIRMSQFAVPDMPAPIRANFWAPNTDWGDAYSAALQPVNNAGANTSWLYDIDHIAVRRTFSGIAATSPGRVFTDTFRNGSVANSDGATNFWTQRNQGAGSSVIESAAADHAAEPLKLRAAGAGFPHAQIVSPLRGEMNFFKTPIAIEAAGIGFTSTSHRTDVNTIDKSILRFSLASQTLASGSESEYTIADAMSLRIEGTNLVAFGYKVNTPNANSEYNVNLLSQAVSGPVRSVKLVLHGSFYRLEIGHDVSENDSAQTSSTFSGPLALNLADWNATGDAAMFVQGQLNNSGANENMTAQVDGLAVSAVRPTWSPAAGGSNWNTAANWDWQIAPNFRDADAIFGGGVVGPQVVSVDAPVTVGSITFDSADAHRIEGSGAGRLTFDTYTGDGRIDASAGAHTIATPVTLLRPLIISAAGDSKVTLAGDVIANGHAITKSGGGEAEVRNVRTTALNIASGVLTITDSGGAADGVSNVGALAIAAGARLDLRDNKLVTNAPAGTFDGVTYTGVQGEVQRAYHFGAWDMPGLTTSEAHAGQNAGVLSGTTTIGVATASQVLFIEPAETGLFMGQTVTGAVTIAMYTYAGDLNFDGLVDGADYGVIDNFVQFPGTSGYANGDFNYDGVIDGADYGVIDNTIQLQGAAFPGVSGGAMVAVAVPEPSAACGFAILAASSWMGRRPRRRRQRHVGLSGREE